MRAYTHARIGEANVLLFHDLTEWYPLVTRPEDYRRECASYVSLITEAHPNARTLLDLGSGGGHCALHLSAVFDCTMIDISKPMIDISSRLNPGCRHQIADMREVRLDQRFDVVFLHDAVHHMRCIDDLKRAIRTAFVHLHPGAIALLVPNYTTETFSPYRKTGGHADSQGRSLRYAEQAFPREADCATSHKIVFTYWLSENGKPTRTVHDMDEYGLFSKSEWMFALSQSGFEVTLPSLNASIHRDQVAFLCRRPSE